jgi:hypothetical protein
MHTEEAAQYTARLQSPLTAQATEDPRLQNSIAAGKIRFRVMTHRSAAEADALSKVMQ